MSSAFVKEGEYQPLNTVEPELSALLFYLRRENGGITVSETKSYFSEKFGREVHEMSDGLSYALNDNRQWTILLDAG
jgi:hypothetical protein